MSALAALAPLVIAVIAQTPPDARPQPPTERPAPTTSEARPSEDAGAGPIARDPFARGTLGIEFDGLLLAEAWNLNGPREWLAVGSAAVSWAFVNRAALVVEFQAARVFQRSPRSAHVQGFAPIVRWQLRSRDPWRLFVELGPGISWSDTTVPPRGTRFNYLIVGGGGLLHRIGPQVHAVAGARWWHLSNNSREGRSRNPDIEALGGYAGVAIAF
jgi:hypothetical protein